MKVTWTIAVGVIAATVLLFEGSVAQTCSRPTCRSGALIDTRLCKCNSLFDSTCLSGFDPVQNEHGHCSCEKRIPPSCNLGYSLNTYTCNCKISRPPTCPRGSSLSPSNALCIGEHVPYCPRGYVKYGCECVKESVRQCSSGTLSTNKCKCSRAYTPTCSNGCRLNPFGCTCQSDAIKCFDNLHCSGYGRTVNSIFECCRGIQGPTGPLPADLPPADSPDARIPSITHSYREGNGPCISCFH